MSLDTLDDKQKQDAAHNLSQQEADEKFNRIASGYSSNAEDLQKLENHANSGGVDDIEKYANDPKNASKNIDATREKEQNGGWKNNVTGGQIGPKKEPFSAKTLIRRKGPMGLIILLAGGGGILGAGILSPGLLIMHVKAIILNKVDSLSSAKEVRDNLIFGDRMFGTSILNSRFKGLTKTQFDRLKVQGVDLLDADGKPVQPRKIGPFTRYYGTVKMVLPSENGEPREEVTAKDYKRKLLTSSTLRNISRLTNRARYLSFNDSLAKEVRARNKLTTNPDWGDENDDKATRKTVFKAVAGETNTTINPDNTAPPPETNPDGTPKATGGTNLDFGDDTDAINEEAAKLKAAGEVGDPIAELPDDVAGASELPDYEPPVNAKSVFKSVLNFLNPAAILTVLCTVYQLADLTVFTAQTIEKENDMRFASLMLSTSDKTMAGDGTPADAEKASTIFERPDAYGDNFGDSVSYQYSEYGTIPDKPLTSSGQGNDVIQTFATVVNTVNNFLGGPTVVHTGCGIITNPFVQGALALTSFIPAGSALKGLTAVLEGGAREAATKFITEKITAILTKDGLKAAGKSVTLAAKNFAKGPGAIILAQYLLFKYGVPFIARVLAGATISSDANGVKAMDTTGNGADAINEATGMQNGLSPLTPSQSPVYNQFNQSATATYVADMQSQSNPFDLANPYSLSSNMGAAFYPLLSKFNLFGQNGLQGILSIPASILSSLNVTKVFGSTALAAGDDTGHFCDESYIKTLNLKTTLWCHTQPGIGNVNMLQNEKPDDVATWMKTHNQITNDDSETVIPGSNYEKFISECIPSDTNTKTITSFGDSEQQLSSDCYGDAAQTTEHTMFQLYYFDKGITDEDNDN